MPDPCKAALTASRIKQLWKNKLVTVTEWLNNYGTRLSQNIEICQCLAIADQLFAEAFPILFSPFSIRFNFTI